MATYLLGSNTSRPQGSDLDLDLKVLASASTSASRFWPRPRPQGSDLSLNLDIKVLAYRPRPQGSDLCLGLKHLTSFTVSNMCVFSQIDFYSEYICINYAN